MPGAQKLLRPYPEAPIVRCAAEAALASAVGPVAVVVDPSSDVAAALAGLPLTMLANHDAAAGASTSVRKAAEWAFGRSDALILTLGDEPDVDPAVISALFGHWRAHSPPATRVRYRDRPGHPVLITRRFLDRCRLEGDAGLGPALTGSGEHDLTLDADAPPDIDTETEYRAALARLAH